MVLCFQPCVHVVRNSCATIQLGRVDLCSHNNKSLTILCISGKGRGGSTPRWSNKGRCFALLFTPARFKHVEKHVICLATNNSSGDDDPIEDRPPTEPVSTKVSYELSSTIFDRWNVPWDGKAVVVTTLGVGSSFLLTGLVLAVLVAQLGYGHGKDLDLDDQALFIFINQLVQTLAGITVLNSSLSSYKPIANDIFNYDWKNPFDLQRGWLLWGVLGLIAGAVAVLSASMLASTLNGEPIPREEQDALLRLLPLIGTSNRSTVLLVVITGILAPYLEETIFRGFLLPSFTKWMPTPMAVVLSASLFALAHFTPGEIPQLFGLGKRLYEVACFINTGRCQGIVLGFSYAKTRNLLTPIMIHAFWNSGVVLLLTYLRWQGYNLQEFL